MVHYLTVKMHRHLHPLLFWKRSYVHRVDNWKESKLSHIDNKNSSCGSDTTSSNPLVLQTGSKLNRNSRFSNAPSRPKEGWSMVVQDVSNENSKKQYVATPSGKTRSLTADEQVYLDRMVPKKRKKIV